MEHFKIKKLNARKFRRQHSLGNQKDPEFE